MAIDLTNIIYPLYLEFVTRDANNVIKREHYYRITEDNKIVKLVINRENGAYEWISISKPFDPETDFDGFVDHCDYSTGETFNHYLEQTVKRLQVEKLE
jgi:hypothetical protein